MKLTGKIGLVALFIAIIGCISLYMRDTYHSQLVTSTLTTTVTDRIYESGFWGLPVAILRLLAFIGGGVVAFACLLKRYGTI
jgi:hypothetical protein